MSHPITKLRNEYQDNNYGLTDSDMDINVTCTLSPDQVKKIREAQDSHFIPFAQVIDDYDRVASDMENFIKFYNVPDAEDQDLKLRFVLNKAAIRNIQFPSNPGGSFIGGTFGLPSIHALNFPTDHISDGYRKVFDLNKRHYLKGRPHSFVHALKHSTVDKDYTLVSPTCSVSPDILLPGTTERKHSRDPVIYSWVIDNDSVYNGVDYPQVSKVYMQNNSSERNNKNSTLNCKYYVDIPSTSYLRDCHNHPSFINKDTGECKVDLENYANHAYVLLDKLNHGRVTTLERSGILWDIDHMDKNDFPVKFQLDLNIHPIVPMYDDREQLPYENFKNGLRRQLHEVKHVV